MTFSAYIDNGVHVGSGFRLCRATIIGPYPTPDFIEQVLDWRPEEVILAVDDGWPQERIDDIWRVFAAHEAELILWRVAPAVGNGLVHAKLYCLEWVNAANNRRRHTLLAGSANASSQGFGIHAEAFVHVDLANIALSNKKEVLQYFGDLAQGEDVNERQFYIGDKSWLSIPALRVVRTPWPNGFDAWIRRGRLCHSYQPDPTFGRLVLRLKEPMPQGLLGTNLGNFGFGVAGETQAFTRPYVSYASDAGDDRNERGNERQNWRQRYFTETVYGYWTSAECFKQFEDEFVAPHAEGRELALDAIRYADRTTRLTWIDDFMRSIGNVFETLTAEQRKTYFHVRSNGMLDAEKYRQQAEAKLDRDRGKARDDYFCKRFTSGFAFPPVPALGSEFEDFALDLSANLLAKLQSRRVNNKLAAAVRDYQIAEPDMSPEELLGHLRDRWDEIGVDLARFFAD